MKIEPMQAMVDAMSAEWKRERAATQMTLGSLIAALEKMHPDAPIQGVERPHSYRGYYEDLAFQPRDEKTNVATLLQLCRLAMGRVYEGYKGGDFVMGETTPVWMAHYGCCGQKIISLRQDGTFETRDDE